MTKYQVMTIPQAVEELLDDLQEKLENHGYWQDLPPTDDALASDEPFAIDMLTCTEWLQWVFITKMRYLIIHQLPMPMSMVIAPYVNEALINMTGSSDIIKVCAEIDALFHLQNY